MVKWGFLKVLTLKTNPSKKIRNFSIYLRSCQPVGIVCVVCIYKIPVLQTKPNPFNNDILICSYLVISTSSGIMDHEEARRKHTGGKLLGFFY